jgi:hypothetical protein
MGFHTAPGVVLISFVLILAYIRLVAKRSYIYYSMKMI